MTKPLRSFVVWILFCHLPSTICQAVTVVPGRANISQGEKAHQSVVIQYPSRFHVLPLFSTFFHLTAAEPCPAPLPGDPQRHLRTPTDTKSWLEFLGSRSFMPMPI